MDLTARELLVHLYQTAVDAVDGRQLVQRWCRDNNRTEFTHCVAIGKASAAMLQGALDSNSIKDALLIGPKKSVQHKFGRDRRIRVIDASHPLPDESSVEAGHALIDFLKSIPEGASLLVLISGGTSSLVEVPVESISLEKLQTIYRYLLASGKDIHNVNAWRKKFSRIKGGGLLAHVKHLNCTQLLISDVEGDDISVIGSGLLVANTTPVDDDAWLHQQYSHQQCTHQQPDQGNGVEIESHIIGNLDVAKNAVAAEVEQYGLDTYVHDEFISGEAAEQADKLGHWLVDAPAGLHIWCGETTVTLPDKPGLGGRNQSFALAAARCIDGHDEVAILAAGTDGIDGNTPCAGAIVTGTTLPMARQMGFDVEAELTKANAGVVLMATGGLLNTGPSNTNVMDLVIAYKRKLEEISP